MNSKYKFPFTTLMSYRTLPILPNVSHDSLGPCLVIPQIINIYLPNYPDGILLEDLNIFLSFQLSKLVCFSGSSVSPDEIAADMVALVGALCNLNTSSGEWEPNSTVDLNESYSLKLKMISSSTLKDIAAVSNDFNDYIGRFSRFQDPYLDSGLFLVLTGVTIMMMMNVESEDYEVDEPYDALMANRIEEFTNVIGQPELLQQITADHFPDFNNAKRIKHSLCFNFDMRKKLFLAIRRIAESDFNTPVNKVAIKLMEMMKGTDLKHLLLVQKYLIERYPAVQRIHYLGDLKVVYEDAVKQLHNLCTKDDMPYAKILFSEDETNYSHLGVFRFYTIVAATIEDMVDPTTKCRQFQLDDRFEYGVLEEVKSIMRTHYGVVPASRQVYSCGNKLNALNYMGIDFS